MHHNNMLRLVRSCMLAGIAGMGVICLTGQASAQRATTPPAAPAAATSTATTSTVKPAAATAAATTLAATAAAVSSSVVDPGVRSLTTQQQALNQINSTTGFKTQLSLSDAGVATFDTPTANFFNSATARFQEVDSVSGGIAGEDGSGLGPRFNSNSCASCHVFPTVGGSSPPNAMGFTGNPQVAVATLDGARNTIPSFITQNGPVREARFVVNPDGSLDGGVHDLFTITGRTDAGTCSIAQPPFAIQLANLNVIFRIPTPTFGVGLVENTPDGDQDATIGLIGAFHTQDTLAISLGIGGFFNRSGNDGTITRFGWKAQNKSLLIFAGEAYNVEQGVTNELFSNERDDTAGCRINALPEDHTNLVNTVNSTSPASDFSSDSVNFAAFMRLTAPPQPATLSSSAQAGQSVFFNIGCGACHIQSQTTSPMSVTNTTTPQPAVTFQPFSDFALHDMGLGLADGIFQGNAGGHDFRTAPLWGVGQRVFFLHDGRTSDLVQTILQHDAPVPSTTTEAIAVSADGTGSEAHQVIQNFKALSATNQQNLLNFLRSL
jgi:CxxC motif-containing protein (DUF1111 family)